MGRWICRRELEAKDEARTGATPMNALYILRDSKELFLSHRLSYSSERKEVESILERRQAEIKATEPD